MKKLIYISILFLFGCSDVERHETPVKHSQLPTQLDVVQPNSVIGAQQIFREDKSPPLIIHIISYNGHEYMLARKNDAGGLTHTESCPNEDHIITE